jgi:hypothetical protein
MLGNKMTSNGNLPQGGNLIKQAEGLLTTNTNSEAANSRATAMLLSAIARLLTLQAAKEAHLLSQTIF